MRHWGLIFCTGLVCGLSVSGWGGTGIEDGLKLSQSTPDMIPLIDSLRTESTPHPPPRLAKPLDDHAINEFLALRRKALSSPQDPEQRAEAGQAAWLLGLLHLHGASVSADPARARQWFTLSAHYGEPLASAGMAWCALYGCLSLPNLAQAQYWTQRLMHADPARAAYFQWLIGRQLHPLNPWASEGLRSQAPLERYWLDTAVNAGSVHAMIAMGILHAQDHELRQSLNLFERAAPHSEVAAQNALWIRQRIALEQASTQARSAASANEPLAETTFRSARAYHRGDGVPINYGEAIRLYRKSDREGSVPARRMLSLIYSRTSIDGTLDPVWMRQLSELDLASPVPKQELTPSVSALRKEPTALIDLLPANWRQWIQ